MHWAKIFHPLPVLIFAGCSLFESQDSSRIRLSIQGNTTLLRRSVSVSLSAPGWRRSLTGGDFGSPDAPNYTQTFDTPTAGDLRIGVLLKDSTGLHVSSGSISLAIRPDWAWGVDIVLGSRNPYAVCFGCIGYRGFQVDPVFQQAPEDSMFIVWGGNSIKHPVIY